MQSWFTSYSSLYSSVTSHQEQVCSFIDASALLDFFLFILTSPPVPSLSQPKFPVNQAVDTVATCVGSRSCAEDVERWTFPVLI